MKELYQLKNHPSGESGKFTIIKFSQDIEVLSIYTLTKTSCTCKQAMKGGHCRHQKMIGIFERNHHIGDGYFLDMATHIFQDPILAKSEMDNLVIGKPDNPFLSNEDRLVNVVAPRLETEGSFSPVGPKTERPEPQVKDLRRRKLE